MHPGAPGGEGERGNVIIILTFALVREDYLVATAERVVDNTYMSS